MSVFCPESECRILSSARGSTAMAVASRALVSPVAPYITAGTSPAARVLRASFLPHVSRAVASSVASIFILLRCWNWELGTRSWRFPAPSSQTLHKQTRDRRLLVNRLDGLAEEPRHREHDDLAACLTGRRERNRIGDDQLVDRRVLNPLDRLARQHAVHRTRDQDCSPVGLGTSGRHG